MEFPVRKGQDGYFYLLDFENIEREFKQIVKAVCPEDLVAMTNGNGGSILIGVEEIRLEDNTKTGKIIGCPLTDELKQNVNNKASSCLPSIKVDFEEHWVGGIPFVEIIIHEGSNKPYCTASGCYRMRLDGGNRAIDPQALIAMVLERESQKFLERFHKSTVQLEKMLTKIAEKLEHLDNTMDDNEKND
ncbi:ATP-binding protein [bacterium]|nr:ATP-binding protein [bacterium]